MKRANLLAIVLFAIAGCGEDEATTPMAPRVVEAMPMAGSLHVSWVNEEVGCDTIEVERRMTALDGHIAADFAVIYRLPGAIDNKHDDSANENATYTYRLRCLKAAQYSPYSNELSANPHG